MLALYLQTQYQVSNIKISILRLNLHIWKVNKHSFLCKNKMLMLSQIQHFWKNNFQNFKSSRKVFCLIDMATLKSCFHILHLHIKCLFFFLCFQNIIRISVCEQKYHCTEWSDISIEPLRVFQERNISLRMLNPFFLYLDIHKKYKYSDYFHHKISHQNPSENWLNCSN